MAMQHDYDPKHQYVLTPKTNRSRAPPAPVLQYTNPSHGIAGWQLSLAAYMHVACHVCEARGVHKSCIAQTASAITCLSVPLQLTKQNIPEPLTTNTDAPFYLNSRADCIHKPLQPNALRLANTSI